MKTLAGSPDSGMFSGFAAAASPPRSTTNPRSWVRAGQVGHRRAVPAGVDVRGAGHGHELVNHEPPPAGVQVQAGHQRVGANSDAPDEGVVATFSPADNCTQQPSRAVATDWLDQVTNFCWTSI